MAVYGVVVGSFSGGDQMWIAPAKLALGFGSSDQRSDPGGIAIELLPPGLRDHMPDRYIGALPNQNAK